MLFIPLILQSSPNFLVQWVPLIFIMLVVYFLMIRPQAKKAKEQSAFQQALQKGDTVATGSGIVGKISKIDAKTIQLQIDNKTFIEIVKSTVSKEMTDYLNNDAEDKK